jgi:magnesium-protoporphyrin O-methyltransferase
VNQSPIPEKKPPRPPPPSPPPSASSRGMGSETSTAKVEAFVGAPAFPAASVALAVAAAQRGAHVTAIDLSSNLVDLARERIGADVGTGQIDFRVGDMFDPALGRFDHVVGMDSLIHYKAADVVRVLAGIAARTDRSMLFTFAPSSAFLQAFLAVGRLVPRGDRSPAIVPVAERTLRRLIAAEPAMAGWRSARTHRVARGFYTSQALEVLRD